MDILDRAEATWALFQQISADTKDPDDIPHCWPQMKARGLAAIQYTAREIRSGLQFVAYAQRRSAGASALFAQRIQTYLERCGVDLRHSQHERIPPAAHTYQSDVETVHRLIEEEFFDLDTFRTRAEFLAKASLFRRYLNLARPNSHKGGPSPWQTIHQLDPDLPLDLCLLPPVLLDYRLDNQGR